MSNKHLENAKNNVNDEFYTRLEDIEKIIPHIGEELEGKEILLPCDNPMRSMFYEYLKSNFEKYKLKKLTAINLCYMVYYDGEIEDLKECDGDIRHENINTHIEGADVIITNPPFSLFGTFFNKIKNKPFLIVAPITSLIRDCVFELIKENKCFVWDNIMKFENPQGSVVESPCLWLTNIKDKNRKKFYTMEGKKLDGTDYYNFNTNNAFLDHTRKYKAVPLTYVQKHDPERFEIIELIKEPRVNNKKLFSRILIKDKEVEK